MVGTWPGAGFHLVPFVRIPSSRCLVLEPGPLPPVRGRCLEAGVSPYLGDVPCFWILGQKHHPGHSINQLICVRCPMGRRPRVQWSPPPSRSIPIDGGPGPVAQPPSPYVRPASAPPRRRAPSKDPVSVQSPSSPKGPPFERGPGPNFQPRRDLLLIRIPTPTSNQMGAALDQNGSPQFQLKGVRF